MIWLIGFSATSQSCSNNCHSSDCCSKQAPHDDGRHDEFQRYGTLISDLLELFSTQRRILTLASAHEEVTIHFNQAKLSKQEAA